MDSDADGRKRDEQWAEVDPNYDPRDETEIRPHVAFDFKQGCNQRALFDDLIARLATYHDIFTFAPKQGAVPAFIRFAWDTPRGEVDAVADWLRTQPFVVQVTVRYGHRLPPANER